MDPTLAPDFVPPSEQPNIRPAASQDRIPSVAPIQPYQLEESLNTQLGARRRSCSSLSDAMAAVEMADIPDNIPKVSSVMSASPPESEQNSPPQHPQPKFGRFGMGAHRLASPLAASYLNEPSGVRPLVQSADLEEVPIGVTRQAKCIEDYQFPVHRLSDVMLDETKSPLVLVACGSFSPVTYLHLRMFEMAMDSIREHTRFEVIGGYYSPVSDNYKKPGLAKAHHRVRMCELACERTSTWLMVDAWESLQPAYTRTALVLDHFNEEINIKRQGVRTATDKRKGVKIMLLAGGDLIESMGEPNVWAEDDLDHILGRYGCIIIERTGSDVRSFLLSHDIMYEHRRNVLVIKQLIYNDISSTKVRLFLRRGMSVQYLLPNSVIRYILEHGLYVNESEPVKQVMSERGD
jgi:nicotinamide mononucleotide adenylyltransferase